MRCRNASAETTTRQIEAAFKEFTQRPDIGVVLISQYVRYRTFAWRASPRSRCMYVTRLVCIQDVLLRRCVATGLQCCKPAPVVQIANMIRQAISSYNKPSPAILEIPSKDCPYDPTQDSILSRVQFMFGVQ